MSAVHKPAEDHHATMPYRRCGASGLKLPAVSLGAWETMGGTKAGFPMWPCPYGAAPASLLLGLPCSGASRMTYGDDHD